MKKRQEKIINQIITSLYSNTTLSSNFVGGFVLKVSRLDKGIGFSSYCKYHILKSYIEGAHNADPLCMTIEQFNRFDQQLKAVYIE